MAVELGYILLLIVLNGALSMSEMAIVSSRKLRLQQLSGRGDRGATRALGMAEQPTRFLSTVQVGITSIGILSGALGEDAIAKPLLPFLQAIPELAPYAEKLALVITVALITYLSLIVGELVPKRVALNFPERVAAWIARPMHVLSVLALPVVKMLSFSTELVLSALRVKPESGPSITEEEIKLLLAQSAQEGILEETESRFIANILKLDNRRVGSIMTLPRDVVWLDLRQPFQENRRRILAHDFQVLPLCDGGLENVIGFVKTKDVLDCLLLGGQPALDDIKLNALFVPDTLTLLDLLEAFIRSHLHTALVVDEYGDIHGLVTLDDVFEAIVGAWIAGRGAGDIPAIVQREDGSWLVDGMLDIHQFKEHFRLAGLPDENGSYFNTVGGFVLQHLGRVPKVGEYFVLGRLRMEIVDMDGNRVDKVLVSPLP